MSFGKNSKTSATPKTKTGDKPVDNFKPQHRVVGVTCHYDDGEEKNYPYKKLQQAQKEIQEANSGKHARHRKTIYFWYSSVAGAGAKPKVDDDLWKHADSIGYTAPTVDEVATNCGFVKKFFLGDSSDHPVKDSSGNWIPITPPDPNDPDITCGVLPKATP